MDNLSILRGQEEEKEPQRKASRDVQEELQKYIIPGVKAFHRAGSQRLREASGNEKQNYTAFSSWEIT